MKRKLMILLAALLTGGMLVACGPGEDTTDDTVGGGGGVVGEPLTDDPAGDNFQDADGAAQDDAMETVELEEEAEVASEDAAAADTPVDMDVTTEESDVAGGDAAVDAEAEADAQEGDVAGGGAAAPAEGEMVTVTFSQAAEGVAVENVQGIDDGESIAATDETNPDLNLTTGQRYEFVFDGEGDLVFYDSNDEQLFATGGSDSQFAGDEQVNAEMDDDSITFTLTEELGQELARYTAGSDDAGGNINVN